MKDEMPKWLEIQQQYIEAGVKVEVLKATRTPSAWAEIITAFAGAAGQQVAASLNSLGDVARDAILATNPILSLIYTLSGGAEETPPPSGEEAPQEGDNPPSEDNPESWTDFDSPVQPNNYNQTTTITITRPDPISGGSHTWQAVGFNFYQHRTLFNTLTNNSSSMGHSNAWQSQILAEYRDRINATYNVVLP